MPCSIDGLKPHGCIRLYVPIAAKLTIAGVHAVRESKSLLLE